MQIQGMMGGMDMSAMREMRAAMFAKADTNKSGGLSLEEFGKVAENGPMSQLSKATGMSIQDVFGQMDADGDGALTSAEMEKMKPPGQMQQMMSGDMMAALMMLQEGQKSDTSQTGASNDPKQAINDLISKALDAFTSRDEKEDDNSSARVQIQA